MKTVPDHSTRPTHSSQISDPFPKTEPLARFSFSAISSSSQSLAQHGRAATGAN